MRQGAAIWEQSTMSAAGLSVQTQQVILAAAIAQPPVACPLLIRLPSNQSVDSRAYNIAADAHDSGWIVGQTETDPLVEAHHSASSGLFPVATRKP
jgi:hypothetical protein